jgi:Ni/Co efflux regulator RcnB
MKSLFHFITGVHMKTKALVFAVIAACLTSGAAFAQTYDHYGERYERTDRDYRDYQDYRREQRRDYGYHQRMRGAGPYGDIHRGERLPHAYWGRENVVRNWRRHGLSEPRYGHNWVRTGDDFVQVSVSTGIVTRVLLRD